MKLSEIKVLIKGGGDLGSGVAWKLFKSNINVAVMDLPDPMSIRRHVSFSTAIIDGTIVIENVHAKLITDISEFSKDFIPVFTTAHLDILQTLKPDVIVDATLKGIDNRTTNKDDAPLTIGLGPGFKAPENIDCIIETNRGHNLGKVIWQGEAEKYTGVPGNIQGYTYERLLRAPDDGKFEPLKKIGDHVQENELVGWVNRKEVRSMITGIIRGLIAEGTHVKKDSKIGDIDPRNRKEYIFTVSDKARSIGGGVLEAILGWIAKKS